MRGARIGLVLAALLLAGCGGPDAAAEKACTLLRDAQNDVNGALWAWVEAGKPAEGSSDARQAALAYPSIVADAAAAAPAEMASDFAAIERMAPAIMSTDRESYVALSMTVSRVVEQCEDAGVDMPMVSPSTGVVS